MASRLTLHAKLMEFVNYAYYQPPTNIKMNYPCIRYSLSRKDAKKANNKSYIITNCYELVYIDEDPDAAVPDQLLLELPMISLDRTYIADNLHHWVFTLYY